MTLQVYGRSDDLVEVEGDVREEFIAPHPSDRLFLTFSNGVVLLVEYGAAGEWNVSELYSPVGVDVEIFPTAWVDAPVGYSETAVVEGGDEVEWVLTGEDIYRFEDQRGVVES